MRWGLAAGILTSAIAAPAFAAFVEIQTPGSQIEASFPEKDAKAVSALIADGCMDINWTVAHRDEFQVECRDSSYGAVFNRYTKNQEVIRFNLAERDGSVRVRGQGFTEVTNGFGQVSQSSLTLADQKMLRLLRKAGGQFPAGTVFEDYGIGVYLEDGDTWPLIVEHVLDGSRAADAGVQRGDRIEKINGKGFADKQGLKNRVAKYAPADAPLTITLTRAGQRMTLQGR